MRDALAFCDVDTGKVEVVRGIDTPAGTRLNDGAVDPAGAFWVGSMHLAEQRPLGSFYRVDASLTVTRAFGGLVCSNGPAWSPDGATMYHVDSTVRLIRSYPVTPTGWVGDAVWVRRSPVRTSTQTLRPPWRGVPGPRGR